MGHAMCVWRGKPAATCGQQHEGAHHLHKFGRQVQTGGWWACQEGDHPLTDTYPQPAATGRQQNPGRKSLQIPSTGSCWGRNSAPRSFPRQPVLAKPYQECAHKAPHVCIVQIGLDAQTQDAAEQGECTNRMALISTPFWAAACIGLAHRQQPRGCSRKRAVARLLLVTLLAQTATTRLYGAHTREGKGDASATCKALTHSWAG